MESAQRHGRRSFRWGSRGRRFKSGRPNWSEPHFERRNRTASGWWERNTLPPIDETAVVAAYGRDITPLAKASRADPRRRPPSGALVSGSKGPRFTSAVKAGSGQHPPRTQAGSVTVSDGDCLKRTRTVPSNRDLMQALRVMP